MESSERKAHVCCDCKARSPETDTNYTLISSRYGWRLSRHVASDGSFVVEWRCPRCWERHKMRKASTPYGGGDSENLSPDSGRSEGSLMPPSTDAPRSTPTFAPTPSTRPRRASSSPPPRPTRPSHSPSVRASGSSIPPTRKKK